MSNYGLVNKDRITDIANSLRNKLSETSNYSIKNIKEKTNSICVISNTPAYKISSYTMKIYNETKIRPYAAYADTNITSVSFQNCIITTIYGHAFENCSKLNMIIPTETQIISPYAFNSCTSLTSAELPNLETLGAYAFNSCTALTSIDIPMVTSIGYKAFATCTGLSKIFIPSTCITISATSYTYSPFLNCNSTLEIYTDATAKLSGWGTYWNYYASGATLTVHYGVTKEEYDELDD